METVLFLTADYANREQTGKLNVLGVFNRIFSHKFPAKHHRLYVVIRMHAELGEFDTDHDLKVLFLDSDGAELGALEGSFKIPRPEHSKSADSDIILEVNDLLLPNPGRYEFRLIINKEVKSVVPLDADLLQSETAE